MRMDADRELLFYLPPFGFICGCFTHVKSGGMQGENLTRVSPENGRPRQSGDKEKFFQKPTPGRTMTRAFDPPNEGK
jgi:hypothetical protein